MAYKEWHQMQHPKSLADEETVFKLWLEVQHQREQELRLQRAIALLTGSKAPDLATPATDVAPAIVATKRKLTLDGELNA